MTIQWEKSALKILGIEKYEEKEKNYWWKFWNTEKCLFYLSIENLVVGGKKKWMRKFDEKWKIFARLFVTKLELGQQSFLLFLVRAGCGHNEIEWSSRQTAAKIQTVHRARVQEAPFFLQPRKIPWTFVHPRLSFHNKVPKEKCIETQKIVGLSHFSRPCKSIIIRARKWKWLIDRKQRIRLRIHADQS